MQRQSPPTVAAVVIGRNEGERLVRCLASLAGKVAPIIYVDSGSTDGSPDIARAAGAQVIALDMAKPFTAGRARNAGLKQVTAEASYVQVIDGDCELQDGWIETSRAFLEERPDVAMVAGRLRERRPEVSIWNRLADAEWHVPAGECSELGGIAMLRRAPVMEMAGYKEDLIAGEEPELCLRLRRRGWKIWRLPDEMAWHDIAMTRLSQWWQRSRRAGYTFAEGVALHGRGPERYRVRELRSLVLWGAGVPAAAVLGAFLWTPWAMVLLLAWPIQMTRLWWRGVPIEVAVFLVLGKLPEVHGALGYLWGRIAGRPRKLIEYK